MVVFLGINVDLISTLGIGLGIDWLFWAWAIFTVLAFIDILIPDPIPFIDEALLTLTSVILLLIMGFREGARLFNDIAGFLNNPFIIAFAITITALMIGGAIYKRAKK